MTAAAPAVKLDAPTIRHACACLRAMAAHCREQAEKDEKVGSPYSLIRNFRLLAACYDMGAKVLEDELRWST